MAIQSVSVLDRRRALPCVIAVLLLAFLPGCGGDADADAYGNFEATEVTVSAQAEGRLMRFLVNEGQTLTVGQVVGLVDTTQLVAQRQNLVAQRRNLLAQRDALFAQARAAEAQTLEADAGVQALTAQLTTAEEELERTRRLAEQEAATARELNEREGATDQLRAQLQQMRTRTATARAQADVPRAQAVATDAQVAALDAQLRQIDDRLANAFVTNPEAGTVLTVAARAGEVVRTGTPLYTVARLDTLTLRAYATGTQLPRLRLGERVEVLTDDGDGGLASRAGTVAFIAPQAEFTPTPIQTRDERAELVYAFEVRVANPDGHLKIGMPAEVRLPADTLADGGTG